MRAAQPPLDVVAIVRKQAFQGGHRFLAPLKDKNALLVQMRAREEDMLQHGRVAGMRDQQGVGMFTGSSRLAADSRRGRNHAGRAREAPRGRWSR